MSLFEMQNYAGSFVTRERGMFGIHFVNSTGGALDTTWVAADYAAVEAAISTWWTALASTMSNQVRLVEHRWYPFGPGFIGTKSSPIPPSRVTTLGAPLVGSDAGTYIRQVASTVTLRSTLRRHWGRFYVPYATSIFSNKGQMTAGNPAIQAGLARTMLLAAESSQGVVPVIYDRLRKQVYGVTAIEVDSVPDIQRRRRPRDVAAKSILTA